MLGRSTRRAAFYTSIGLGVFFGAALTPWYGAAGMVGGLIICVWAGGAWLLWSAGKKGHPGRLFRALVLGLPLGIGAFVAALLLALLGVLVISVVIAVANKL